MFEPNNRRKEDQKPKAYTIPWAIHERYTDVYIVTHYWSFVVSPSSRMSSIESSLRRLLEIQQDRFCGSRHIATIIHGLPTYALPISLRDQEEWCMHKCEMVDFLLVVRPSRHQSITAAQCSSRPGPSPLACAVVMNNNWLDHSVCIISFHFILKHFWISWTLWRR